MINRLQISWAKCTRLRAGAGRGAAPGGGPTPVPCPGQPGFGWHQWHLATYQPLHWLADRRDGLHRQPAAVPARLALSGRPALSCSVRLWRWRPMPLFIDLILLVPFFPKKGLTDDLVLNSLLRGGGNGDRLWPGLPWAGHQWRHRYPGTHPEPLARASR